MQWRVRLGALLMASVLCAGIGCSSSETTGVKQELNDQEKQQIQDLNKQREEEWKKRS